MIWFVCLLILAIGVPIVFVIRAIIKEGAKDEIMYPLGNCETSMYEECMNEPGEAKA